jgi:hypothetical protein
MDVNMAFRQNGSIAAHTWRVAPDYFVKRQAFDETVARLYRDLAQGRLADTDSLLARLGPTADYGRSKRVKRTGAPASASLLPWPLGAGTRDAKKTPGVGPVVSTYQSIEGVIREHRVA